MASRKPSASGPQGGPMINPSVEPSARRESAEARRASAGNGQHSSGGPRRSSGGNRNQVAESARAAAEALLGANDVNPGERRGSTTATDTRNQRRSIGLKRISVTDQLRETVIDILTGVAREVNTDNSGLQKLQDIMTQAKEKGLGVGKLFHFFLLSGAKDKSALSTARGSVDGNLSSNMPPLGHVPRESESRGSVHATARTSRDATNPNENRDDGRVFKDTQSSKIRTEGSRSSRGAKKKSSMELMPSLQKGKRPSTATSKRASGSRAGSATARPGSPYNGSEPGGGVGRGSTSSVPVGAGFTWKNSLGRRSSAAEEAAMRDRQISSSSFKQGLSMLGFKLTEEEMIDMFGRLDVNADGVIDLTEFTRFCLEIPSMAWKAERARRGIVNGADGMQSDLDKAAREIANEVVNSGENGNNNNNSKRTVDAEANAEANGLSSALNEETSISKISLGRTVFKGEKFFWRTKELIEVVLQLNARAGFMALSTFHAATLEVYPIIFVDPSKIPVNAAAVADRLKELEVQHTQEQVAAAVAAGGVTGTGEDTEFSDNAVKARIEEARKVAIADEAHMGYLADYLLERICMPDEKGELLQADLLQPDVQVNPSLPLSSNINNNNNNNNQGIPQSAVGVSKPKRQPGLMRSTLDEWDTLLFPNPPEHVGGMPKFAKTKKRESYFQEFENTRGEFNDNRVKAQRLSTEAAAYSEEVSALMRKLAPLSYSASAPAIIREDSAGEVPRLPYPLSSRPGTGRVVLADDLSQGALDNDKRASKYLMTESQSAPALPSGS